MILEAVSLGLLAFGTLYCKFSSKDLEKRKWIDKWEEFIEDMDIVNMKDESFEILDLSIYDYGVKFILEIPIGLTIEELILVKPEMENFFKGVCSIDKIDFSNKCTVTIIIKDTSDFEFVPVKCKDSEVYIGKTLDLQDYKIDLSKGAAHLLIGAPSGKGKSFLLASILTNLIYNSSDKIELYLLQMMKGDVSSFENCKCTKQTAYTLEGIANGLEELVNIAKIREKIFNETAVKGIKGFNNHYPELAFKRIFIVTEEISFFMPKEIDSPKVAELKTKCLQRLNEIVLAGRSSGLHLITVTQRSTAENIPPTMKSMMIRVTLGQISTLDSTNIIECEDAVNLKNKECFVYGDIPGLTPIRIPTIDEDFSILNKYVPEIKVPESVNKSIEELRELVYSVSNAFNSNKTDNKVQGDNVTILSKVKLKDDTGNKDKNDDLNKINNKSSNVIKFESKVYKSNTSPSVLEEVCVGKENIVTNGNRKVRKGVYRE